MTTKATVTLSRALKIKNQLVNKINSNTEEVKIGNAVIVGQEQADIRKLWNERQELVTHLINLKTSICLANTKIQSKIFELAEMKTTLSQLNLVSTSDGDSGQAHYGTSTKIFYTAVLKKEEVKKMKEALQLAIDDLQETLDAHNATTKLEIDSTLLAAMNMTR